jgi:hypothetical protein
MGYQPTNSQLRSIANLVKYGSRKIKLMDSADRNLITDTAIRSVMKDVPKSAPTGRRRSPA